MTSQELFAKTTQGENIHSSMNYLMVNNDAIIVNCKKYMYEYTHISSIKHCDSFTDAMINHRTWELLLDLLHHFTADDLEWP